MRFMKSLLVVLISTWPILVGAQSPQLTVTSISPTEGPVAGGTVIEVRGTGFEPTRFAPITLGTQVSFGDTLATDVIFVDSTRLRVITPPHFPGAAPVRVFHEGEPFVNAPAEFTFLGDVLSGFDAVLFPIFAPRTNGAFGSIFETTALVWNRHTDSNILLLYGATELCLPVDSNRPLQLIAPEEETPLPTDCSLWPARLLYTPKGTSRRLAASLRVSDITRQGESHGVEIPVVRLEQFTRDRIALVGAPSDLRFRKTLRIYAIGANAEYVEVRIDNSAPRRVDLTPGRSAFEPAFAVLSNFPSPEDLRDDQTAFRVTVDTPRGPNGVSPAANGPLIWAFISVTNNDTQMITTVTPQHSSENLLEPQ